MRTALAQPADEAVIAGYAAPFPVPESRVGVVTFPELAPTAPDDPSAAALLDVSERLRRWDKPALVLFSDSDPIFSGTESELIAEVLPDAELADPLRGAGHFLQEDRGAEIGQRVVAWLT